MVRVSKLQFLAALVVAGVADSLQKLKDIRAALKTKQEVPTDLSVMRWGYCKTCPMFFKPLGTCGSPLRRKSPVEGFDGCFCHAATLCVTKSNCTAFDFYKGQTLLGWPASLNSFPYE